MGTDKTQGVMLLNRLVALVGRTEADKQREAAFERLMARRKVERDGKDSVMSGGVASVEAHLQELTKAHDEPVTPGMTQIDTGLASIDRNKVRLVLAPVIAQERFVLERIRDAAYGYLIDAESQILAGQIAPDVVARGHAFVELELARRAPDALTALTSAQERVAQGDDEALSHATASCRRAIKALADALFPPTAPVIDEDGARRVLDDERYRNRLVEYVRQHRGRSTHADLVISNLSSFTTRLKSLDDLASKGVHARITLSEAESCISWTYMLAADLLRVDREE